MGIAAEANKRGHIDKRIKRQRRGPIMARDLVVKLLEKPFVFHCRPRLPVGTCTAAFKKLVVVVGLVHRVLFDFALSEIF